MQKVKFSYNRIIFAALFLVFIAYLCVTIYGQQEMLMRGEGEQQAIAQQIQNEQEKQQNLQAMSQSQDSDEYIEKMAREKLGLVKPEEIIFVDGLNK